MSSLVRQFASPSLPTSLPTSPSPSPSQSPSQSSSPSPYPPPSLPVEIWLQILSLLPVASLASLSLTSRLLHVLSVPSLHTKPVAPKNAPKNDILSHLTIFGSYARVLFLPPRWDLGCDDNFINSLTRLTPNLSAVILPTSSSPPQFNSFLANLPSQTVIYLTQLIHRPISNIIRNSNRSSMRFPCCDSLLLHPKKVLTHTLVPGTLPPPSTVSLYIPSTTLLTPADAVTLVAALPNLRNAHIPPTTSPAIITFLRHPKLISLTVSEPSISEREAKFIAADLDKRIVSIHYDHLKGASRGIWHFVVAPTE